MSRRLCHLSVGTLDDLPEPCRSCTFWEVAGAPRGGGGQAGRVAKERWLEQVTSAWDLPGRVAYLDEQPVAFALLVPGQYAGRTAQVRHRPSPDALLLATMWIHERARGAGLGRVLLQAVLRDTHERGGHAVEAYGARGAMVLGTCVLSQAFLLANGFSVLHDDARMPLLRLDLRTTVRWQESIAGALEQAVEALSRRSLRPVGVRPARSLAR